MAVYQSPMPIPAYRAKRKAGCISETASYGTNNQRLRNHILLWKIPLLRERNGRLHASVSDPYKGLCTALHLPPRGRPTFTAALLRPVTATERPHDDACATDLSVASVYRTSVPGATPDLSGETSARLPSSIFAASSIPCDSTPISFAGWRFATTITVLPTISSGV